MTLNLIVVGLFVIGFVVQAVVSLFVPTIPFGSLALAAATVIMLVIAVIVGRGRGIVIVAIVVLVVWIVLVNHWVVIAPSTEHPPSSDAKSPHRGSRSRPVTVSRSRPQRVLSLSHRPTHLNTHLVSSCHDEGAVCLYDRAERRTSTARGMEAQGIDQEMVATRTWIVSHWGDLPG